LKKFTLTLMLMFVLLCFTGTAYATDWTEWPAKTDVPIDKVWTITFNQPTDYSNVDIYITYSNGTKRATKITPSADKKSCTVDAQPYESGKVYYLKIDSENLKNNISMEFTTAIDITPITYKWSYAGNDYIWGPINYDTVMYDGLLNFYRTSKIHPMFNSYFARQYVNAYTLDPDDNQIVSSVTKKLLGYGYSGSYAVEFGIAYVQGMPYTPDNVSTPYDEYPRYPLETILENGGDCEDTALLSAVLLREMGYGTAIIFLPGHAALGVLGSENVLGTYYLVNGKRYYYTETTGDGWPVGAVPDEFLGKSAIVIPLFNEVNASAIKGIKKVKILTGEGETVIEDDRKDVKEFSQTEPQSN